MATGAFWNISNPKKPWGLFDPNAELVFPIEVDQWLADMATSYASHTVIAPTPLEQVSSSHAAGVISVRIRVASGAEYEAGTKYPFTIRLVGADGQTDDRTLWLKLEER